MTNIMLSLRLTSFAAEDTAGELSSDDSDTTSSSGCGKNYVINMFGLDERGKTYCISASAFTPYFYAKVPSTWLPSDKQLLRDELYRRVESRYWNDTIVSMKLIRRNKLYGFDPENAQAKFIRIDFCSEQARNKFKNLWYSEVDGQRRLGTLPCIKNGVVEELELYEAHIPPLLRFFHCQDISPTGWVSISKSELNEPSTRRTTCDYEATTRFSNVHGDNEKQSRAPYKVMSFDIEASSSHGDFPLAKKDYRALARELVQRDGGLTIETMIRDAFNGGSENVSSVHPKEPPTSTRLSETIRRFLQNPVRNLGVLPEELKATRGKSAEAEIDGLTQHFADSGFPSLKGDETTFIGSSFYRMDGGTEPYLNDMLVVGTCSDKGEVDNTRIRCCEDENEMLLAWTKLVQVEDPDVIIGYNIMGFDFGFMYDRSTELGCEHEFLKLSRRRGESCCKENWKTGETNIAESQLVIASGQHDLRYIDMPGRLIIDLYNVFRRDYNLSKYSLNYVSGQFIGDTVKNIEYTYDDGHVVSKISCKNVAGLQKNSYVCFEHIVHSTDQHHGGAKFKILSIAKDGQSFTVEGQVDAVTTGLLRWGLAKDDVSPQDIFRLTAGTADDRYTIAKYCVKDCTLVYDLFLKTDVMTSFVEMGGLCSVPMSFLVLRGQGIKLTSYMAKKCREKATLMPTINKGESEDAYEGAVVLDPKQGVYLDDPVACVDYSSLYPSCMISDNISHDSKVWTKDFDLDGNLIRETGERGPNGEYLHDGLSGYEYVDVAYDTYKYVRKAGSKVDVKTKVGRKVCRYAQFPGGRLGIVPSILKECLAARKATRKQQKLEEDPFMRNVLDKRQLSIKITANSIYGQCGAKTSTFYDMDIAASTTALGRKLLLYAKDTIEECYRGREVSTSAVGKCIVNAEYVYGDTDSVFFKFNPTTTAGDRIVGKPALELTIELAKEAGKLATKFLKEPHDLEYEKTFWPFILLSRKRYVGMLYEEDVNKCSRKAMGIVLKRRDNAPIVKDIYGGVIDILMRDRDANAASRFLASALDELASGRVSMDKLVLTKALRGHYKNPALIAHKVLADRIAARDPGNKPKPGDRIEFVYIKTGKRGALQGDKIETPAYVKRQRLRIDYDHYVTNQVMKPVQQVFGLMLEDLDVFKRKYAKTTDAWKENLKRARNKEPLKSASTSHEEKIRNKEVKELLFTDALCKIKRSANGNASILQFLKKQSGL